MSTGIFLSDDKSQNLAVVHSFPSMHDTYRQYLVNVDENYDWKVTFNYN